ncbi:MAG: purine phosphoribosyltransferase family protein [Euryarchaeota archaeon]|nr:purine phosphoribosyltransferase family protein [Euryarchaeota archaeon]
MLKRVKETLRDAPVVKFGDYMYFVHPVTDGVPEMTPTLLEEIVDEIVKIADLDCDRLITAEAMGIPVTTALSLKTGLPFSIIRKREYRLPGEFKVDQQTGYSNGTMSINGVRKGDRVVFIDVVLSTGGTLRAIVKALRSIGAVLKDVIIVVEKGEGKAALEKELGVCIKTLVKVDIVDGKVWIIG